MQWHCDKSRPYYRQFVIGSICNGIGAKRLRSSCDAKATADVSSYAVSIAPALRIIGGLIACEIGDESVLAIEKLTEGSAL